MTQSKDGHLIFSDILHGVCLLTFATVLAALASFQHQKDQCTATNYDGAPPAPFVSSDYLHELRQRVRDAQQRTQANPTRPRLEALFSTPVLVLNARDLGLRGVASLNSRLAAPILRGYDELLNSLPPAHAHAHVHGHQEDGPYQLFYEWTMAENQTVWRRMQAGMVEDAYETYLRLMHLACDTYLEYIGIDPEFIQNRSHEVHTWPTVQRDGSTHRAHSHPGHMLSAVYYVLVPPDVGQLVLHDPRGPLPPFDSRYTVDPQPGDIVVFPSWLVHEVTASPSTHPRVSIPINFAGEWSDTTHIQSTMYLDESAEPEPESESESSRDGLDVRD